MSIERFEKIFLNLIKSVIEYYQIAQIIDINDIMNCSYNYYLKVMDDVLFVYYYYYHSSTSMIEGTELIIVRSNGNIYKSKNSELYNIGMDIRYLDYLSIMTR